MQKNCLTSAGSDLVVMNPLPRSMWDKAAAIGSVILLFAQIFRLFDGENNPVVYVCEL